MLLLVGRQGTNYTNVSITSTEGTWTLRSLSTALGGIFGSVLPNCLGGTTSFTVTFVGATSATSGCTLYELAGVGPDVLPAHVKGVNGVEVTAGATHSSGSFGASIGGSAFFAALDVAAHAYSSGPTNGYVDDTHATSSAWTAHLLTIDSDTPTSSTSWTETSTIQAVSQLLVVPPTVPSVNFVQDFPPGLQSPGSLGRLARYQWDALQTTQLFMQDLGVAVSTQVASFKNLITKPFSLTSTQVVSLVKRVAKPLALVTSTGAATRTLVANKVQSVSSSGAATVARLVKKGLSVTSSCAAVLTKAFAKTLSVVSVGGVSSGGGSPTLSVTGYTAWYDATVGVTDAGGGAVSAWADQSGNGNHLTQGTGAKRPTTGVDTLNGLNVIKFSVANATILLSAAITLAQPVTVFMVMQTNTPSSGNQQALGNAGACPTVWGTSSQYALYAGGVASGGTLDTAAHYWSADFNGSSSNLWIDGAAVLTLVNAGGGGWSSNPIGIGGAADGSGNYWDGDIAEFILYPSELNTTDRQSVEAYLNAKWFVSGGGGGATGPVLLKLVLKPFSLVSTGAPTIARFVTKLISGAVTSTASVVKLVTKFLSAGSTESPSLLAQKVITKLLTVTSTGAASILKLVFKPLPVTSSQVGSMVRSILKSLSATVTSTPSLSKVLIFLRSTLSATSTGTPTLTKVITKPLSAISSGTATMTRLVLKLLSLTSSGAPTATRLVQKFLSGLDSGTPSVVKLATKPLSATSTGTPAIVKLVRKVLSAASSGLASLNASFGSHTFFVVLSATSTQAASFAKLVKKNMVIAAKRAAVFIFDD